MVKQPGVHAAHITVVVVFVLGLVHDADGWWFWVPWTGWCFWSLAPLWEDPSLGARYLP